MRAFRLIIPVLFIWLFFSCEKNKTYFSIDDLQPQIETKGFVSTSEGNMLNVGNQLEIRLTFGSTSNANLQFRFSSADNLPGNIKYDGATVTLNHVYNTVVSSEKVLIFLFTATEQGQCNFNLELSTDNFVKTKTVNYSFKIEKSYFKVAMLDVPESVVVGKPFTAQLSIEPLNPTHKKVYAYGKFTYGQGVTSWFSDPFPITSGKTSETVTDKENLSLVNIGVTPVNIRVDDEGDHELQFLISSETGEQQTVVFELPALLPDFSFTARTLSSVIPEADKLAVEFRVDNKEHPTNKFNVEYSVTSKAQSTEIELIDTLYVPISSFGDKELLLSVKDNYGSVRTTTLSTTVQKLESSFSIEGVENIDSFDKEYPIKLVCSNNTDKIDYVLRYETSMTEAVVLKLNGETINHLNTYPIKQAETDFTVNFLACGREEGNNKITFFIRPADNEKEDEVTVDVTISKYDFSIKIDKISDYFPLNSLENIGGVVMCSRKSDELFFEYELSDPTLGKIQLSFGDLAQGTKYSVTNDFELGLKYLAEREGTNELTLKLTDKKGNIKEQKYSLLSVKKDIVFSEQEFPKKGLKGQTETFTLSISDKVSTSEHQCMFTTPSGGGSLYVGGQTISAGGTFLIRTGDQKRLQYTPDKYGTNELKFSITNDRGEFSTQLFMNVQCRLAITSDGEGITRGAGIFDYETTQNIIAAPKAEHKFTGWFDAQGSLLNSSSTYSVLLNSDKNITAKFEALPLPKVNLFLSARDGVGTVEGGGIYDALSEVTIKAIPSGSTQTFIHWEDAFTGAVVSTKNPYSFTMPKQDLLLDAIFVQGKVRIDVDYNDKWGVVTGMGVYEPNMSVSLIAEPKNEGYISFVGWYKNGALLSNKESYSIDTGVEHQRVEARFRAQDRTITLAKKFFRDEKRADEGRTIIEQTPRQDVGTYYINEDFTIKNVPPSEKYIFYGLYDDSGNLISTDPNYTSTITPGMRCDYEARYVLTPINVTFNPTGAFGGWIYVSPIPGEGSSSGADINSEKTVKYRYGDELNMRAAPLTGSDFDKWVIDGVWYRTQENFKVTLTKDIYISCDFVNHYFAWGVTRFFGYMGEVLHEGRLVYKEKNKMTAIPSDEKYMFVKWVNKKTGEVITENPYTYTVYGDMDFEAYFEPK